MTAKQIPANDFRRTEIPVHLVVIDQTAEQAEERWGWEMERGEYETDNAKFAMCTLVLDNGDEYFVMSMPEATDDTRKLSVSVHADFGNPAQMEQNLVEALGLSSEEIFWRNEAFSTLIFRLYTRDEDGKRVVISNHQNMDEAVMARSMRLGTDEGGTYWVDKRRDDE